MEGGWAGLKVVAEAGAEGGETIVLDCFTLEIDVHDTAMCVCFDRLKGWRWWWRRRWYMALAAPWLRATDGSARWHVA